MKQRLINVPITLGRAVVAADVVGSKVRVRLNDNTFRVVDHVILATGYRVDASKYELLSPAIRENLHTVGGYPVLGRGMESSVAGLHFVGQQAAGSFGPLLHFISGTEFAGRELVRIITTRMH